MVQHLKAALRKEMLARRDALQKQALAKMSRKIARKLLSHERFMEAESIAFYVPKGSEADTTGMINAALRLKKKVLAPVTGERHIEFRPFLSLSELVPGKFGILEPPQPGQNPSESRAGTSKPESGAKKSKTKTGPGQSHPKKPEQNPAQGAGNPAAEPDLIIIPGIAFGLCMHRLGYGRGYYDRFLSGSPAYRIGICFDFQVVERLPTHENDERMDEIITDKRIIRL